MGTNYYLVEADECLHCGRKAERGLHIGKSSYGWAFALHVYPEGADWESGEPAPRNFEEWKTFFREKKIINEYGESIPEQSMISIITERGSYKSSKEADVFRHEIDMRHCIGHGDGPWDLIVGKFS